MESALVEMLAEHPTLALVACDAEGLVTLATPALEKMLGARFELGRQLGHYVSTMALFSASGEQVQSPQQTFLARALNGETVTDEVLSLRRSGGHTVYARCNAAPVRHDGQISGAVVLVQDVTAELTASLLQGELRDRLVSTVNHELRTPITKILGHAELLTEPGQEAQLTAQQSWSVRSISRASQDLAVMADRLARLSRLDTVNRMQPVEIDLAAVLRSFVDAERLSARSLVDIRFVSPSELPAVVDWALIERATGELLSNAMRYAPRGSTVEMELQGSGNQVDILMADQGPGIPVGDRRRLVQPFERGELPEGQTSTAGLGLALVTAVAAAHGGSLTLGSNTPHGLVARLRLQRLRG